jgi:hypothetical protein
LPDIRLSGLTGYPGHLVSGRIPDIKKGRISGASLFFFFRKSKLAALAAFFLNKEIQTGGRKGHSPEEDAKVTGNYLIGPTG